MAQRARVWWRGRELAATALMDIVGELRDRPWELEVGFGKGRYLLRRATEEPERCFLGIEIAGQYYRMARDRAARRGLENLVLVHGEALFLLDALLPHHWVDVAHVYFPDPWPKARHHKRRLFDPETIDVLLRSLEGPSSRLYFASDHVAYATRVRSILEAHPGLVTEVHDGPWPDGARTNYEAKYETLGRTILRLSVGLQASDESALLHPDGLSGITSALAPPRASDDPDAAPPPG